MTTQGLIGTLHPSHSPSKVFPVPSQSVSIIPGRSQDIQGHGLAQLTQPKPAYPLNGTFRVPMNRIDLTMQGLEFSFHCS